MPRGYSFFSNNNIVKYALLRGFTNYEDALSSQIQSIDWLCGNEFKVKEPKQAIVLSGNRRMEHYGSYHNYYKRSIAMTSDKSYVTKK